MSTISFQKLGFVLSLGLTAALMTSCDDTEDSKVAQDVMIDGQYWQTTYAGITHTMKFQSDGSCINIIEPQSYSSDEASAPCEVYTNTYTVEGSILTITTDGVQEIWNIDMDPTWTTMELTMGSSVVDYTTLGTEFEYPACMTVPDPGTMSMAVNGTEYSFTNACAYADEQDLHLAALTADETLLFDLTIPDGSLDGELVSLNPAISGITAFVAYNGTVYHSVSGSLYIVDWASTYEMEFIFVMTVQNAAGETLTLNMAAGSTIENQSFRSSLIPESTSAEFFLNGQATTYPSAYVIYDHTNYILTLANADGTSRIVKRLGGNLLGVGSRVSLATASMYMNGMPCTDIDGSMLIYSMNEVTGALTASFDISGMDADETSLYSLEYGAVSAGVVPLDSDNIPTWPSMVFTDSENRTVTYFDVSATIGDSTTVITLQPEGSTNYRFTLTLSEDMPFNTALPIVYATTSPADSVVATCRWEGFTPTYIDGYLNLKEGFTTSTYRANLYLNMRDSQEAMMGTVNGGFYIE